MDSALFPLSSISKPEVRRIAQELGLEIAGKKDSTGICFIGERNFREFLKNYIPMKEGKIVDIDTREVIGTHQGVYYYTIGQRKGFGVGGNRGPYYCVGKNIEKNILYLTSIKNEHYLLSDKAIIKDINWIRRPDTDEIDLCAKFRYRQNDQAVHLRIINDNEVELTYKQGIKAVTCGQQAVFYSGDELLGGGTIEETYNQGVELSSYYSSIII